MRLQEIRLERPLRQPDARPIPGEMIAELVSLCHKPSH
jgi:hypothetical protein